MFNLVFDADVFKLLNKFGKFETAVFVAVDDDFRLEDLKTVAFRSGFRS